MSINKAEVASHNSSCQSNFDTEKISQFQWLHSEPTPTWLFIIATSSFAASCSSVPFPWFSRIWSNIFTSALTDLNKITKLLQKNMLSHGSHTSLFLASRYSCISFSISSSGALVWPMNNSLVPDSSSNTSLCSLILKFGSKIYIQHPTIFSFF